MLRARCLITAVPCVPRMVQPVLVAARVGLAGLLALGLTGCVGVGVQRMPFGAFSVTVAPGETGVCQLAPCEIFLVMPPGDGEYRVTGNHIDFGTYPAGQTVSLGQFYEAQVLAIEGAGVPRAFVYLPVLP